MSKGKVKYIRPGVCSVVLALACHWLFQPAEEMVLGFSKIGLSTENIFLWSLSQINSSIKTKFYLHHLLFFCIYGKY